MQSPVLGVSGSTGVRGAGFLIDQRCTTGDLSLRFISLQLFTHEFQQELFRISLVVLASGRANYARITQFGRSLRVVNS